MSCPNSQLPVAIVHRVHRWRFSGRACWRAANVPIVPLSAALVQATS